MGAFLLIYSLISTSFLIYELKTEFRKPNHLSNVIEHKDKAVLQGTVSSYPETRNEKIRFILAVDTLFMPTGQRLQVEGRLLVSIRESLLPIQYGDFLKISPVIRKPANARNPGEFDYANYLAAQNIYATASIKKMKEIAILGHDNGNWFMQRLIIPVKNALEKIIERLPFAQSALLKGLLIGIRSEISPEVREDFAKVGVIHILAVSGLHVGFIIITFMTLCGICRLNYKTAVAVTILGLIFYAFITDLKPPVLRASVMGGLVLVGAALERKTNFLNSLSVAALLILILRPQDLFQAGFQLSFIAVISIVYIYPALKRACSFSRKNKHGLVSASAFQYIYDLLLVSLAAFIGTAPLTALYFHRLPLLSLPANLVVVPLSFLTLGNGIAAAFSQIISTQLADVFLTAACFFITVMMKIAEVAATIPFADLEIYAFQPIHAFAYFTGILFLMNLNNKKSRTISLIATLLLLNLIVWRSAFAPRNSFKMTFIDVGQGDSVLLQFPDGRSALIDAGKRSPYYDSGKRVVAPFLKHVGIQKLDILILSHADSDHLGGFPYIMRHFEVGEIWDNGAVKSTKLFGEYQHLIDSLQIKRRVMRAGEYIADFAPVIFQTIHPSQQFMENGRHSANDASLSFKISYGEIDLLTLGDVEKKGEGNLCRYRTSLTSEILKVSHHGSKTSSTQSFLEYAQPQLAVISVGEDNKFGHPAESVLKRLQERGAKIVRTDESRAIILATDGKKIEQLKWY